MALGKSLLEAKQLQHLRYAEASIHEFGAPASNQPPGFGELNRWGNQPLTNPWVFGFHQNPGSEAHKIRRRSSEMPPTAEEPHPEPPKASRETRADGEEFGAGAFGMQTVWRVGVFGEGLLACKLLLVAFFWEGFPPNKFVPCFPSVRRVERTLHAFARLEGRKSSTRSGLSESAKDPPLSGENIVMYVSVDERYTHRQLKMLLLHGVWCFPSFVFHPLGGSATRIPVFGRRLIELAWRFLEGHFDAIGGPRTPCNQQFLPP